MRQSFEVAIELTAQELLSPPSLQGFVEIDDIDTVVTPQLDVAVANTEAVPADSSSAADSFEIELTPEDMDKLLGATR